jgi:hypothetical protein
VARRCLAIDETKWPIREVVGQPAATSLPSSTGRHPAAAQPQKEIIMFKTILMTAAAAVVATAAAAPAHAFEFLNGGGPNGLVPNGWTNGLHPNGWSNGNSANGHSTQGHSTQGTSTGAASFVIDGIELPTQAR